MLTYHQLMVTNIFLVCLLILTVAAKRQEVWVRYAGYNDQALTFAKYLRSIDDGYFIDIGGFYPLWISNTAKLTGWKGLMIQANQQRAKYHNLFEPDITTLTFAMSNVSGEIVTFYEAEDVSSLSPLGTSGNYATPIKVMTINLADLCHKYYKTRPIIMNIDVQGMGQLVLKSNDWKTEKCRPDLIYAEDFQNNVKVGLPNIEELLRNQSYVKIAKVGGLNKIFIRQDKVQLYKKEAEKNKDKIANLKFYEWQQMSQDIGIIIGSPISMGYRPNVHRAFVYVRQPSIIDILQLNKYSNQISEVGPNRPFFIFEYDQKVSSLYLGTDNFTIEKMTFKQSIFEKIIAKYAGYTLTLYIFDHQQYDVFKIRFLDPSERRTYYKIRFPNQPQPQPQPLPQPLPQPKPQSQKRPQKQPQNQAQSQIQRQPQKQVQDTVFADQPESSDNSVEQIFFTIIFTMLASTGIIYILFRRQQNSILANK